MRNSFASSPLSTRRGVRLMKTPSYRQQVARRRWMVAGGMLALALVSGAVGMLTARPDPRGAVETGPFSYFPYQ
ncbi:hypothetical protein [Phenylobacterium sp.]|uniref:hypothetical protein n=1 Tax=Phenylobacterium sp. TaxID=1871053 RepID=UPI0028127907|nr:hypothetical protein [Phenylobacterium sp.]